MSQQEVISFFENGHKVMAGTIKQLTDKQMTEEAVLDDWTTKDILAHLSAWSLEAAQEIDRILKNESTWHTNYSDNGKGVGRFNENEVAKRRKTELKEIIKEWNDSFHTEMNKIRELTKEEWQHQSNDDCWPDGAPATVYSLYGYLYNGEQHEAAHARQIQKHFGLF